MNVLITNAVPLNGGDEALLRATVESLLARWPEAAVRVTCNDPERARPLLGDLELAADLEHAGRGRAAWIRGRLAAADGALPRFRGRNRLLRPLLAAWTRLPGSRHGREEREERDATLALYRAADVVISTPGGFLHDHYAIEDRLRGLELALELGKTVVVFAQSIGPFWKPPSRRRVRDVLGRVHLLTVRDEASREHLIGCGLDAARVEVTADAAFLWRRLAPELFRPHEGPVRRVALSFREWPLGDEGATRSTMAKAAALASALLDEEERELVFLSTCQGVPGYVDDSLVGRRIVDRLPEHLRARCHVDREHRHPRELIRTLGACDAYIGMRLHGAILSWLGGTPAMGIAYEQKTPEVFRQLGLSELQLGVDEDAATWCDRAARFLAAAPEVARRLPALLDRQAAAAARTLDLLESCLRARRAA